MQRRRRFSGRGRDLRRLPAERSLTQLPLCDSRRQLEKLVGGSGEAAQGRSRGGSIVLMGKLECGGGDPELEDGVVTVHADRTSCQNPISWQESENDDQRSSSQTRIERNGNQNYSLDPLP
jgi:hypothetical protein